LLKESAGLSNFISKEIGTLALKAAADHSALREKSGIIEIERLRTNLLSSQPLCFNFFGLISLDHELGLKVVQSFYPEISAFHGVFFEYAPIPKRICSPPLRVDQTAKRAIARPASSVGVVKVDVFGHQAGRAQLGAPALHRFGDEVVGHTPLHLAGLHR
jgi:hypothetical protein